MSALAVKNRLHFSLWQLFSPLSALFLFCAASFCDSTKKVLTQKWHQSCQVASQIDTTEASYGRIICVTNFKFMGLSSPHIWNLIYGFLNRKLLDTVNPDVPYWLMFIRKNWCYIRFFPFSSLSLPWKIEVIVFEHSKTAKFKIYFPGTFQEKHEKRIITEWKRVVMFAQNIVSSVDLFFSREKSSFRPFLNWQCHLLFKSFSLYQFCFYLACQ